MSKDIVELLRSNGEGCECNAWYSGECCCDAIWGSDYAEKAAIEIEKLRALITAWADDHAHPVVDGYVRCTCQDRQCATGTALRKAVGR